MDIDEIAKEMGRGLRFSSSSFLVLSLYASYDSVIKLSRQALPCYMLCSRPHVRWPIRDMQLFFCFGLHHCENVFSAVETFSLRWKRFHRGINLYTAVETFSPWRVAVITNYQS